MRANRSIESNKIELIRMVAAPLGRLEVETGKFPVVVLTAVEAPEVLRPVDPVAVVAAVLEVPALVPVLAVLAPVLAVLALLALVLVETPVLVGVRVVMVPFLQHQGRPGLSDGTAKKSQGMHWTLLLRRMMWDIFVAWMSAKSDAEN